MSVYTPSEYSKLFSLAGKKVSARTIKRRCEKGMLPRGHKAERKKGFWLIEVADK
jgi:hypothetical protein